MDLDRAIRKIEEHFGSREGFLCHQLTTFSMTGQSCDITFLNRKPILDVQVDPQLSLALAYGAGPAKLLEKLTNLKLSNGEVVSINDIWTLNPMPKGGFTDAELEAVNLAEGEEPWGPNGETLREMIRDTYQCQSRDEEDVYLRRFIAS